MSCSYRREPTRLQDFCPMGVDGHRRPQTAEEQKLVKELCTVKAWSAIEVRGTLFTTEQEAKQRSYDNSGAMFFYINEFDKEKIHYGNIQEILVCNVPGQAPRPVAVMFWHEMVDEKFCKGHLPHLKRGKAKSSMNWSARCEWFSRAYAQNVVFLPKDARTPKNDQILAVTRISDYNPLHHL